VDALLAVDRHGWVKRTISRVYTAWGVACMTVLLWLAWLFPRCAGARLLAMHGVQDAAVVADLLANIRRASTSMGAHAPHGTDAHAGGAGDHAGSGGGGGGDGGGGGSGGGAGRHWSADSLSLDSAVSRESSGDWLTAPSTDPTNIARHRAVAAAAAAAAATAAAAKGGAAPGRQQQRGGLHGGANTLPVRLAARAPSGAAALSAAIASGRPTGGGAAVRTHGSLRHLPP